MITTTVRALEFAQSIRDCASDFQREVLSEKWSHASDTLDLIESDLEMLRGYINGKLAEEEERATRPARKLTRQERLQAAADAGVDTWEDYRGEK